MAWCVPMVSTYYVVVFHTSFSYVCTGLPQPCLYQTRIIVPDDIPRVRSGCQCTLRYVVPVVGGSLDMSYRQTHLAKNCFLLFPLLDRRG